MITKKLKQRIKRMLGIKPAAQRPETLMDKVGRFVACEMIEGDYVEFGVYRGDSLIESYHSLQRQFQDRIAMDIGGEGEAERQAVRRKIWDSMRFFAFDSFEGLPALAKQDAGTADFAAGMYAFPETSLVARVVEHGVPAGKLRTVKGWFSDTCNPETLVRLSLRKASVLWIDGDLYSSTCDVLRIAGDLIQDGTIIVFDDWFSFRGSPYRGEQKAFAEWRAVIEQQGRFTFQEYHKESWKRMSFIVSERTAS